MSHSQAIVVAGVTFWRSRRRHQVTGPRQYANDHHRLDHDQLVVKAFNARVWLRERSVIRFAPRPRLPAAIAAEVPTRHLRAV